MLLSVFHFYYLGILRMAILLFRIFHRMAHTWKYGARTLWRGTKPYLLCDGDGVIIVI